MIVDCHSHIFSDASQLARAAEFSCLSPPDMASASPEMHLQAGNPAQAVFVLGFVSRHLDAEIPNQLIENYVASHPDRLFGFAGIDPHDNAASKELTRLKQEHGFVGLTLSPACQAFHPCDTRAMKLYELAQNLNMPVYFLFGLHLPPSAFLEHHQPAALDEIARTFPSLKIIISHMGFPWVEQTISLLAKHPNIYADVAGLTRRAWMAYRSLTLAYECGVIEKLLFASDFPTHTVKTAVGALYNLNKITLDSLLPAVPRENLRGIVERDSLSLLGLTLPQTNPATDDTPATTPTPQS